MKNFLFFAILNLHCLNAISQIEFAGFTDNKNKYSKVFVSDSILIVAPGDTLSIISLDKFLHAIVTDTNRIETNDSIANSQNMFTNILFCIDIIVFDSIEFIDSNWSRINIERFDGQKDLVKFFVFKTDEKISNIKVQTCENFTYKYSEYNFNKGFINVKLDDGVVERVHRNDFKYFCFKVYTVQWHCLTFDEIYWKEKAYIEELYYSTKTEKSLLYYNCFSQ